VSKKKRRKKFSFSELGIIIIDSLAFIFLSLTMYGWLVLGREDAAYLAGVFGTVIGGTFVVFEKKEERQNTILLAKLDKEDTFQHRAMQAEREKETVQENENMVV
jgi:hypothetical protein